MKFSIFTVIMPEFTVEETAKKLGEIGFDGVEWRVNKIPKEVPPEGVSYWGYNKSTIDPETIVEEAEKVKKISEGEGLEICALASYMGAGESQRVAKVMEAAKIMGCPKVRVQAPRYDGSRNYNDLYRETVKNLKEIERLSQNYRVKAVIEMHMGNIMPSAGLAHRIVSNFDPQNIGVIYDPGNMVHEGFESWQMGLELLGDYLAHVHVKNASWRIVRGDKDGNLVWKPDHATLKGGIVNWGEVIGALKSVGYDGYLSFEDFSSEVPTLEKIRSDLEYMKSLL